MAMVARRRRLRSYARNASALATAAVLLLVPTAMGAVGSTDAAWTDSNFGNATLSAVVIPRPIMNTCVLDPGLLGLSPVITVTWSFPAGTTYTAAANVNYFVAQGGLLTGLTSVLLGTNLTTTGPVSGVYTTMFRSGILGGLLGGSYGVYLQTKDSSGWTSVLSESYASMGLAGINPKCDVL